MRVIHINAELTRACNLRCTYCFNSSGNMLANELDINEWEKIINIAGREGTRSFLFTGGEPLSRKDSPNIIKHSLDSGLETSILSNGYRIPELDINLIGRLKRVQISLDSADPIKHDSRRGRGSWKTAIAAIKFVREQNTSVELSMTVSDYNISELEGVVEIACNTGSRVLIRPLQYIGRASKTANENFLSILASRLRILKDMFGDIFVEDFAKYVPIQGKEHDRLCLNEGFVTILPDGIIRGTDKLFSNTYM